MSTYSPPTAKNIYLTILYQSFQLMQNWMQHEKDSKKVLFVIILVLESNTLSSLLRKKERKLSKAHNGASCISRKQ